MFLKIWSKRRPKNAKSPLPVDVRHSLLKLPIATQVKLYTHATMTHACHIFSHRFHFDAFSTVFTLIGYNMRFCFDRCVFDRFHTYRICMRFCFDRCVFDESAQRASEYGRPKWIDMNAALSSENA